MSQGGLGERLGEPAAPGEDLAAFEEHTRALTRLFFPWLGLAIAGAALLWWPLDRFIYDDPALRATFGRFRALIIGLDLTFALTLPRLAVARRHAHELAVFACLANLALAGWTLAALGQGRALWLAYGFLMPLFAILLLVPLRARVLATCLFGVTISGTWALHPQTRLAQQDSLAVLSYMAFCTLISIAIGHALYRLVQRDFLLQRRVAAQRETLAGLTSRLERRVASQTLDILEMHRRARDLRAEQRVELARDLQEGLGSELAALHRLVGAAHPARAAQDLLGLLTELDGQVSRVQQALREVLSALRPRGLDGLGLAETLRELVGELERRSGLRFTLVVDEDLPEPLPPGHSQAIYQIAQEGLDNAVRHARARVVALTLKAEGDRLLLSVQDDGVGLPDGLPGPGPGTRAVRARAEALGGQARWTSGPGTRLEVCLPLPGAR